MKIYKYEIPIQDKFTLMLPEKSRILSCQTQNELPMIWCLVNPESELYEYKFELYGTGREIIDNYRLMFIGTIQQTHIMYGTPLVWHLFQDLSN